MLRWKRQTLVAFARIGLLQVCKYPVNILLYSNLSANGNGFLHEIAKLSQQIITTTDGTYWLSQNALTDLKHTEAT